MTKPFTIPKELIMQAYKQVKVNAGCAGIDQQTIAEFEKNLRSNLYKLWNRMSSGCYFPQSVKMVKIAKKDGGERILGVPSVIDRIAETAAKLILEPELEKHFHPDSYGYRPNKSAIDAIAVTRKRCWYYDWVIEFDIKALFDTIPWDLLEKSIEHHTDNKWVKLYIKRWLQSPMKDMQGNVTEKVKGTSQGSPISPLLSNLFMHYAFDMWMSRNFPNNPWARFADDAVLHCKTEEEAKLILVELDKRFRSCGIELHPDKTQIIYCKDGKRRARYKTRKFDFLGYTFRSRLVKNSRDGSLFASFTPAVSTKALKAMCQKIRSSNIRNRTELNIQDIAKMFNPILRGWIEYYGHYNKDCMSSLYWRFNRTLIMWARRKYKKLRKHKIRAAKFVQKISKQNPSLFVHWKAVGFA